MNPNNTGKNMAQKNAQMIKNTEPKALRYIGIGISFAFLGIMVALPLIIVFVEAFSEGVGVYVEALSDEYTIKALLLTLTCVVIVVPINAIFGTFIAYSIAKFEFRGKFIISSLIEIPFAVSPVIVGLCFVLLFGNSGFFGEILNAWDIKIIFALPAIILASAFVTFPFVAKELIALMQEQGKEEEEAAISLGANGWQSFFKVTLPNIKWGLFYGIVLTNARVIGEFGAVAVVSGKIIGLTTTMPLYIEILYNDYLYTAAFAVASVLTLLSIIALILKCIIEKYERA